ncbi:hypothetical protein FH609_030520 [Streptomyces sp. 3MP-14]|uniref:Uncharacterized protein n=1 Tax=Streptomyces mimosae TaxID=2586635 RepID=A0A5N5ZND5_9ACTN|nr:MULTISPECIES: hypothetical protein [Streptomyces]KAB8157449.1 hypothetical protein FH607_030310 [Streptomyces mimosae]KAB8172273.1 hypothetical protein FH609_030520 [Streptomyces sp. 3MP-14]
MDEPRNRTTALDRFEELAGTRIYRGNAFAATGLPMNATGRAVRQQRQRLEARLAVQETWPGDADSPLAGDYRWEEVRAAFEQFQDARRRIVDELLWRWGDTDLGCDCPAESHLAHDRAVLAHARALEAATGRSPVPAEEARALWRGAGNGWAATLADPSFRGHIARRTEALAEDRRVAALTPDDILNELPRLLVSPFGELAADPGTRAELARICPHFSRHEVFAPLVAEGFERIVDEGFEEINAALLAAEKDKRAGRYADALKKLRERVHPTYEELRTYWPFISDWRREDLSHLVALGMNNLAVALFLYHTRRPASVEQSVSLVELAELAVRIAPGRDRDDIVENLRLIRQHHAANLRRAKVQPDGKVVDVKPRGCLLVLIALAGIVGAVVVGVNGGFVPAMLTASGAATLFGLVAILGNTGKERNT